MRKSRLESLLHDYVANDLGDAERRDIEQRLAADPKARALHDEVRAAQDALKLLRHRPEPPVTGRDVFPAIQAAISAQAFEPRPRLVLEGLGTRYYRRLAIAATLLFAVTVGYLSFANRGGEGPGVVSPPGRPPLPVARNVVELGSLREGITPEEFLEVRDQARDPGELRVEPVVNVIEIAGSR